jgi:hypothetical protein
VEFWKKKKRNVFLSTCPCWNLQVALCLQETWGLVEGGEVKIGVAGWWKPSELSLREVTLLISPPAQPAPRTPAVTGRSRTITRQPESKSGTNHTGAADVMWHVRRQLLRLPEPFSPKPSSGCCTRPQNPSHQRVGVVTDRGRAATQWRLPKSCVSRLGHKRVFLSGKKQI